MADSQFQTVFEPKGEDDMAAMAAYILRSIKAVCPRFSYPSDDDSRAFLVDLWAGALMDGPVFHPKAYSRAVKLYASRASREDNPPMPGDIIRFCELATERMEKDPSERVLLEKWRESRREYFERARGGV